MLAALADLAAITATGLAVGVGYHAAVLHVGGLSQASVVSGFAIAILFCVLTASRGDYAAANYIENARHLGRTLFVWSVTFAIALVFLFAAKESALISRASSAIVFASGFAVVVVVRSLLVAMARSLAASGTLTLSRVALVGSEAELKFFMDTYAPREHGIEVVASSVLRGSDVLDEDLSLAAAIARIRQPDAIYILSPWSEGDLINATLGAMMNVPAEVHLGPQRVLQRFTRANIAHIGPIASLHLVRQPLTIFGRINKRLIDLFGALLLLILLLPLFAVLALAIKLDSSGPVFFVQRRYGFNQRPFRILKFRSMRVLEDGCEVIQAVRGDVRVTRMGRLMRRTNLDELPQLINVVLGDMSLVGPRPHALAHNRFYEQAIADYARRHNVKPGLTGWAQVNGLRGETADDELMRARVEHDLFYIDNWSLGFDLRILIATLKAGAQRNAY